MPARFSPAVQGADHHTLHFYVAHPTDLEMEPVEVDLEDQRTDDGDALEVQPLRYAISSYGADYPVDGLRQRLDDLFQKATKLADLELHWSRYLCILVSGFLDNSVRITYTEYARARADVSVADFVESRLRQFQNPKMGSILKLAGGFSQEWRQRLEKDTSGRLGESVNSIVGNRHKIAHGESVGLTLQTLIQYYGDALRVVDLLQKQCGL